MNTKLTLSLDRNIIEQAKDFAQSRHQSLSKLIEGYLQQLIGPKNMKPPVTPLVERLSGVLDARKATEHKREYTDYLADWNSRTGIPWNSGDTIHNYTLAEKLVCISFRSWLDLQVL